jgi:DUF2934 family protein
MKHGRTTITARQTSTLAVMKSPPELEDEIRRRAYELYRQRGSNDGHELDDWLQAESDLAQKKGTNVSRADRELRAQQLR